MTDLDVFLSSEDFEERIKIAAAQSLLSGDDIAAMVEAFSRLSRVGVRWQDVICAYESANPHVQQALKRELLFK